MATLVFPVGSLVGSSGRQLGKPQWIYIYIFYKYHTHTCDPDPSHVGASQPVTIRTQLLPHILKYRFCCNGYRVHSSGPLPVTRPFET